VFRWSLDGVYGSFINEQEQDGHRDRHGACNDKLEHGGLVTYDFTRYTMCNFTDIDEHFIIIPVYEENS
jgi:hypothetical protein